MTEKDITAMHSGALGHTAGAAKDMIDLCSCWSGGGGGGGDIVPYLLEVCN